MNRISGVPMCLAALLLGTGVLLSCDTTGPSGGGYRLESVAGAQTTEVGAVISPTVRATLAGKPVANVTVFWSADSGGTAARSTTTDGKGLAQAAWTLGPRPGVQHLTASLGTSVAQPVTFTVTAVAGALGQLHVSPDVGSLPTVRDSLQLSVTAADRFGNALAMPPLAWRTLDPATAQVSTTGMVHGVGGGTARIVVASGGIADTATVQVNQVATSIQLGPDTLFLYTLGRSAALTVTARDVYGNYMAAPALSWASVDAAIASVDAAGRVTAVGSGTTTIVARSGVVAGIATVQVKQVPAFLTIAPLFPTVLEDDSVQIKVAAYDSLRSPAPAAPLYWSTNDSTVVALHGAGWAVAKRVGQAAIRVTAYGGDPWGQSVVTVTSRP